METKKIITVSELMESVMNGQDIFDRTENGWEMTLYRDRSDSDIDPETLSNLWESAMKETHLDAFKYAVQDYMSEMYDTSYYQNDIYRAFESALASAIMRGVTVEGVKGFDPWQWISENVFFNVYFPDFEKAGYDVTLTEKSPRTVCEFIKEYPHMELTPDAAEWYYTEDENGNHVINPVAEQYAEQITHKGAFDLSTLYDLFNVIKKGKGVISGLDIRDREGEPFTEKAITASLNAWEIDPEIEIETHDRETPDAEIKPE